MVERSGSASTPALVVRIGSERHTFDPVGGPVVIGRDPHAAVRIGDERISRAHVRLEPFADSWQAIDTSSNGMFVDGVRRSSVFVTGPVTVHLGDAHGIPVLLSPGESSETTALITADADSLTTTAVLPGALDAADEFDEVDPAIARAGRAVAARRRELDITQRSLARDKVINAGTLISFEKGRSWPRQATLARLEQVLQWSPGTIVRIRNGAAPAGPAAPVHDDRTAEVTANTVQAPLMAEAVELAMHTIGEAVARLPEPSDPDFTPRITDVLADLRKLESVTANAARNAKGTPAIVLALSAVRRRYKDLMLQAATSSSATLGQRLYGARHQAELSVQETANAAGLPVEVVVAVEAERPVPPDAAATVENLVAQLSIS